MDSKLSVTLLSPAMHMHKTGCADIARSLARGTTQGKYRETVEGTTVYEGANFTELLFEVDSDLASWFGETIEHRPSAWRWDNCTLAPCVAGMDTRTKAEREAYVEASYPEGY
jgi:hypothetical protein